MTAANTAGEHAYYNIYGKFIRKVPDVPSPSSSTTLLSPLLEEDTEVQRGDTMAPDHRASQQWRPEANPDLPDSLTA